MPWIHYNPNPKKEHGADCVVRAIAIAEGMTWDEAYKALTTKAFEEKDMPSVNPIWADYLRDQGYYLYGLPNTCPRCYTVRDFAYDHPYGTYVLGTGSHAIAVIDGNYIDAWNSGNEVPMYFFMKGENRNGISIHSTNDVIQSEHPTSNTPDPTANTTAVNQPSNSGSVLGTGA